MIQNTNESLNRYSEWGIGMQKNKNRKYEFKFSIITAVYNIELFLEETIESVLNQDIGFKKNVQMILIDDGSKDASGKICDKYQGEYPDNIVVVHKTNGGVSAARNEGVKYIKGEYVNFLDGDDKLTPNTLRLVYKKFKKWEDKTDIITIPLCFFDGANGEHILNNKFNNGDRVIFLEEEYDKPLLSMSASFVKSSIIREIKFDENLPYAEDAKVVMNILKNKMCYGVVHRAKYLYRRRTAGEESAIQKSNKNKKWYLNYMEHFALNVLKMYNAKFGRVPLFVQYAIMYDLQWRFKLVNAPDEVLTSDECDLYFTMLREALSYIEDEIILEQRQLTREYKVHVLRWKYGHAPESEILENDICYHYNGVTVYNEGDSVVKIDFITFSDDEIQIEGVMYLYNYEESDDIKIFVSHNGKKIVCENVKRDVIQLSMGENIINVRGFKISFALKSGTENRIGFWCEINGNMINKKNLLYGKFAPVQTKMWNSYYVTDKYMLTYEKGTLCIQPYSLGKHVYREFSYLKGLFLQREKAAYKAICVRIAYHLYKIFQHKEIWLLSDRTDKADDNGEALWNYINSLDQKDIKPVFAIIKDSKDYERISKKGKVVQPDGWLYKWYCLHGAKIISSQGEDNVFRPFMKYSYYYSDLTQKNKFIFLQHGITKDDLTRWLNRYNKNIQMFVTATNPEHNSILDYDYGYTEREVKLTGFPRYDYLYHDEKKYITILPSWRAYLVGDLIYGTGKRMAVNGAENSGYCKMYSELLTNKRFIKAAEEMGYTIRFMCHPNMADCTKFLKINDTIKVLNVGDIPYRTIFAETDLLVTDYSSVAFDFAYLRKPLMYYQADHEEFFSGKHTYDKGYFDYTDDGFGEVAYDVDTIVDLLIDYMKNECNLKDKYRKRIDETFPFNDTCNSQRVYEAIREL